MKLLAFAVILLLIIYHNLDTIRINRIVYLTIKRGIVATDCFWWSMSDYFSDASGIDLYYRLKKDHKILKMNILNNSIHTVMEPKYIKKVLENSPAIFGVGELKYNFFRSFMPLNVGVSNGCAWKRRRQFNEHTLDSFTASDSFSQLVRECFTQLEVPRKYEDFLVFGQTLTMKIVFGVNEIEPSVFKMLNEANGFEKTQKLDKYKEFVYQHLNNPVKGSLLDQMPQDHSLTDRELIDQIPHWIFPTVGAISQLSMRVLALMCNSKSLNSNSLRNCILETLRLNNPVNSTFRKLVQDFKFDDDFKFYKGDQFLIINNPVLRDPDAFSEPNAFRPQRWMDPELEQSYYAIMFNQGPQKCPGKEYVIELVQEFIKEYIRREKTLRCSVAIDTNNVPQLLNPCVIEFL